MVDTGTSDGVTNREGVRLPAQRGAWLRSIVDLEAKGYCRSPRANYYATGIKIVQPLLNRRRYKKTKIQFVMKSPFAEAESAVGTPMRPV